MRDIDADAMIKRLEEWNTDDPTDRAMYNFTMHRINEQPTIESERKNGIPMDAIKFILRKETVSTNPDDFTANEKFIKFMDDPEIASFGRWQHANGFNTALVAVKCDLDKIPDSEPERKKGKWIIRNTIFCGMCECTVCGASRPYTVYPMYYCPNCGAKMEGPEDIPMEYFESGGKVITNDNPV